MLGITDYAWRLVPANPILLRVVEAGGRRRRDLFIRCAYLGLLVFVVITSLVSGQSTIGSGASLNDLAKMSDQIFRNMSYLQLGLVALLAPIFTAGAITQEKDSQTYDILLSTPLTNGQIVLGSLLSRLFFVIALLISGIPIFSITQIFGGVSIAAIVRSFGIAAATAFVTGALAMAIAVFKVGTRRTIFSFYMFVVVYLVGVFLLDRMSYFKIPYIPDPNTGTVERATTSWFTGIHPFLALRTIFRDPSYIPPEFLQLPDGYRGRILGWYLSNPANFYTSFMFFLSFVLVTPSIVVLRRLAQSTVSFKTWLLQRLKLTTGDRTRKPRYVWSNPIAWREAKTKASAARASLMRYGFMAAGLLGAIFLVVMYSRVNEPAKYVSQTSYNQQYRALTIYSGNSATTYQLTRNTTVALDVPNTVNPSQSNQKEFSLDQIRGKMEVTAITPEKAPRPTLAAVTLKHVGRKLSAANARDYLLGAAIIEFAVILLIVTNAAASTVTREKEDGSLDLLLTTPITSRYYIWGKLRGLVSFVLPLVAVPVVSVLMFVVYDIVRRVGAWNDPTFQWIVFPEAVLILPGMLIIVAAFAAILGMQMSLRCRTTVMAVMSSVGIVVGTCAALGWCGGSLVDSNSGQFGLAIGSFSPFTVMTVLINPYRFAEHNYQTDPTTYGYTDEASSRTVVFIVSWIAVGVYLLVVWSMYKSMVKNFDMTIRRQSR
jgi:ABC-type transport system involved in multi-copper enzyme maturation permease subunit